MVEFLRLPASLCAEMTALGGGGKVTILFGPEALTTKTRVVSIHSVKKRNSQQELPDIDFWRQTLVLPWKTESPYTLPHPLMARPKGQKS